MIRVRKTGKLIQLLSDTDGVLGSGQAGRDDAAMIQLAVRAREAGGEIVLSADHYTFEQPVVVDLPVTIRGEGRGTEIQPPLDDFAFKVTYTGNCPDRTVVSFKTPPPHADPGVSWEAIESERDDRPGNRLRLHGVQITDLAIKGNGQGKGIHTSCLTESVFRDLWIMNTTDGAALYLGVETMECVFENLHLSNCGSPANQEATIAIPSEHGNGCNNVHFRSIFVIFPRYYGIEIGAGDEPGNPRLIWFEHCMLHGWHKLTTPAPYDLIQIHRTDAARGIFFANCRLGMGQNDADPENRHLRVRQGKVQITDSVIGGGQSKQMLEAGEGATLEVRQTAFHGQISGSLLKAEAASVTFTGNSVEVKGGQDLLHLMSPTAARISDNEFHLSGQQRPLHLSDSEEMPAGPVLMTENLFTGAGTPILCNLASSATFCQRDNLTAGPAPLEA